jgi:enhancing lycopene biosynthesis protein 2
MAKKTKTTKGADAGTMYAYEKNPHEKVDTPFGKVPLSKKEKKIVKTVADNLKTEVIANAYTPNFKLIDDTVEEIKKSVRKNGVDHYSCNNIYIILQDALKKVNLSGN